MDQETASLLERAGSLRRTGRIDEAIAAYQRVLERSPELADSWYNLAWLQRRARHYDSALSSYRQALDRGIADAEEVHLNRAVILSDHLARPDEAETELAAALALKPDYLAALLNLGNLHEDRGRKEASEIAYRRALAVAPDNTLALSRLAGVVDTGSPAADEIEAALRRQLSSGRAAADRADLGFSLGRLLDSRGDYRQAFEAYQAANRASIESRGAGFRGYNEAEQDRIVDRLIAAFPEPVAGDGKAAPAIFICGMFRSGSTLVEQILAGHSRLELAGELDLIPELAKQIPDYPESVAAADGSTIANWRSFYLDGLAPFSRDGATITDKRPDNFVHIGLIKTLFPGARIVHTRRNRLDNLLSLYFLHLSPDMPYALDLNHAAHHHAQHERLMAHWKTLYPNDIFDMDYDELVRDPKPAIERLLVFLDLDWEPPMLDFHRRDNAVKTASVWQVREPLHARSSGRWRNYRFQLDHAFGGLAGADDQ